MKQLLSIACIFLFLLAGCKSEKQPAEKASVATPPAAETDVIVQLTEEQYRNAALVTSVPETKPMSQVLKANGILEAPPEKMHTISFPLGGFIKSTALIPGMYVKKGALLATVEDAAFIQVQQDYLLTKSKLEFSEADYYRQQELSKSQSNSQRTFQQAKSEYETQKIMSRALAEKLRLIGIDPQGLSENNLSRTVNIYAPISGYISKVNANPGKYVAPTDVLFELMDPSEVHVSLTVYEKDAVALKIGQKVYCSRNGDPSRKYAATIELITPNFNEGGAVEVHCEFDKTVTGMLPGTFINAEIVLNNQPSLVLPSESVVKWQGHFYIFMEEKKLQYKMIRVETGSSRDGFTEIKTILPAQAKVVSVNAYALLAAAKNTGEEN